MSNCIGFLRRSFVVVVTCVITVISMAVAVAPRVSAAGAFSLFNFYQIYQMLHGLLLGDGGGNSQTFGEWLEENMTRTVGSGHDEKTFLIDPGMKFDDLISESAMRLVLGAAFTDGGMASISKMQDLTDSWSEVYDTSDISDVGSGGASGGGWSCDGWMTADGMVSFSQNVNYPTIDGYGYFCIQPKSGFTYPYIVVRVLNRYDSTDEGLELFTYSSSKSSYIHSSWYSNSDVDRVAWGTLNGYQLSGTVAYYKSSLPHSFSRFSDCTITVADYDKLCVDWGLDTVYDSDAAVLVAISKAVWQPGKTGSDSFIGPTYATPAAKQLITDTGTLSGLRLDIQSDDGTPDISAALDHAGVDNVNDLVAGVAAGSIPMSQVYEDMRVVPYVLTDVETGDVVTDLNVSATDAKTKAVALDKDLSIPKDVSAVDAYQVTGKTWDPSLSKYKLPLFDFFPFCLPYDAYQFLTMLDVTPVAPVFQVDTTPLFSHTSFFHSSDGYKITLDLTKYEEVFQILRAGECLAIVVGLCLVSYKLIHGGD